LFAGRDYRERREILARLANVYLVIEGGPGTIHEAEVAQGRGAVLVPIARCGGFGASLFKKGSCPGCVGPDDWAALNEQGLGHDELAETTCGIISALLSRCST
jgi:hypothetical protein